ncbi:MAG TPA: TonB-dependent receptor [Gemmatales bacterium]|nr:TonB-dependent receptor [Gemmatales bacterium]
MKGKQLGRRARWLGAAFAAAAWWGAEPAGWAQSPGAAPSGPPPALPAIVDPNLRQVQEFVPTQPTLPIDTPQLPGTQPSATGGSNLLSGVGLPSNLSQTLSQDRAAQASSAAGGVAQGGSAATVQATTDAGDLIGRSQSALGVDTQRRSPIANEARIRGYRLGQITTFADGAYWFPARNDLDTFLSKIDSGIIRDAVIIKGPYSVRYGPGFAFIDIETDATPRYENGFEWHGRTVSTYRDNGNQFYGRQIFFGGDADWGARLSYGQRTGNDYYAGSGMQIPASYNSRDIDFAYGMDLSENSRWEFGYMRLDQTGLEFPGQVFDTRYLGTEAYRTAFTVENQEYFDLFTLTGFYNRTSFAGDAQQGGKRRQIPSLNATDFTGFTDGDLMTTGGQMAVTWGKAGSIQWTLGADFRFLTQSLNEVDAVAGIPCDLNYPVPRTEVFNTGIFLENITPVTRTWNVSMGGRFDYNYNRITRVPPFFGPDCGCGNKDDGSVGAALTGIPVPFSDLNRNFNMATAYINTDYQLNDNITLLAGFGLGMRPPTPTELYAIGPFLAILQQGFTSVNGNPDLRAERAHQFDVGFRSDFGFFRAGASGFFSWVSDYITYAAIGVDQKGITSGNLDQNFLSVQFVNTSMATLWGTEVYMEMDYNDYITPFVTLTYVEGQDQTRGSFRGQTTVQGFPLIVNGALLPNPDREPLPSISPLEARLGLRLHEAGPNPTYGMEFMSRLVARQNRVAASLLEQQTAGFTVFDIRAYWQARQGILLTGGIENIFNRNYQEHLDLRTGLGVFQPGRNVYVGNELRY